MSKQELEQFMKFKMRQHLRITGFDFKQSGAKEKAYEIFKPLLDNWIKEAIAAETA